MAAQFSASPNTDNLPIFASSFAKRTPNVFACSDEEGNVSITNIKTGCSLGHVRHPDSIFDVQFSADDSRLLLASADEFTYIRDTEILDGNPLMCLGYHQGTVRSARWRPNDPNVLVTAARDGSAVVWDLRTSSASPSHATPVNVLADIHKKPINGRKTVTTRSNVIQAEFIPLQDHLIATIGQPDHCVKIWDTRYKWGTNSTPIPMDQIRAPILPGGRERAFTSFVFDSNGSSIFCANANNNIYQFCLSNCGSTPVRQLNAPQYEAGSFFVKLDLSPCGQYLASGSVQDNTFIWDLQSKRNTCFRVGGHYREVTSVSWSQDEYGDLMLLSCGEDGSVNVWSENPNVNEMLGFGRPTLIQTAEAYVDEVTTIPRELPTEIGELTDLPLRSDYIADLENIRPSTPPNLMIPSSLQTTCKKSVISDYFRPVQPGTSVTEQLLLSHRSSPVAKREPDDTTTSAGGSGLKRLPGILNFCSSPSRPGSKLARSGRRDR